MLFLSLQGRLSKRHSKGDGGRYLCVAVWRMPIRDETFWQGISEKYCKKSENGVSYIMKFYFFETETI